MAEFRINANGERNNFAIAEENPNPWMVSRRGSLQSQIQPKNHHQRVNGGGESYDGYDLHALKSSLGRLSFSDSSPLHHWTNRLLTINSNGGGEYLVPPVAARAQMQMLSFQNDPSTSLMPNNAREVQRLYDQSGYYPWRRSEMYNNNPNFESDPIVSLAKDQVSSQHLQNKILEGSKETIDMIFNQVILNICELMVDHFGSQLIQKLMENCSSHQIGQILDVVTHHQLRFVTICNDPLGMRVIQLLLRCLCTEDQILRIVEEVSKVALPLTRSNHANHVILQCFRHFTPLQNRSLIVVIARNCYHIAIDQFGCCMLQECLKTGCNELKQRLVVEIITNALRLCVNSYGNYVVQYVLELDDRDLKQELVRMLIGNYSYLSRNKYGSHCVQKLLKVKDIDSRLVVNDLLKDIDTLLLDPFGNYVIQTAWSVSQDDMRRMLLWHINRNIRYMRCNMFGNKILEKLQL